MATGLFNLKQVNLAVQQGGWQGAVPSTYSASFNTATLQYLTTVLSSALSGQFTVEFWYKRYSSGNTTLITIGDSSLSTGIEFYIGSSGANNTLYSNNATQISSTAFPFGTWNHIAFTRDGSNVIRLFINGNVVGSTYTSSATFSSSVRIGVEYYASSVSAAGSASISNVRILNGTCLYTTNFAVPTSPLTNITNTALLTLQDATIVDNSSSALSITNTGTVATVVDSGMFSPNVKTPAVDYLVVAGGGGGGGCSSTSEAGGGGGAGGLLTGSVSVAAGTSYTVTVGAGGSALSGSTIPTNGSNSVFGNVVSVGGGYGGVSFLGSSIYSAGSGGSGGGGNGAVSGQSVNGGQGTANQGNRGGNGATSTGAAGGGGGAGTRGLDFAATSYDGNGGAGIASVISGTVTIYGGGGGSGGTAQATASNGGVGGGGNGGIYSGAAATAGTVNTGGGGGAGARDAGASGAGGSGIVIISYPDVYAAASAVTGATVSTSGSGSIYFNGSSYFSYNAQTPFAFGTGDFTIEFWINATSFGGGPILYDCRPSSTNGLYPTIYCLGTGRILFFTNSADAITGDVLSTSTWYHIAVCRIGTSTKMYINGTQAGSTYTDSNNYIVGSGRPTIGGNGNNPGSSGAFYMSNVRVVKGVGVYTGNFTAPTAPLQATQSAGTNIAAVTGTQTSLLLNANSGAFLADNSTNSYTQSTTAGTPAWNSASPFTVTGYKNRVYTWTSSGSITF